MRLLWLAGLLTLVGCGAPDPDGFGVNLTLDSSGVVGRGRAQSVQVTVIGELAPYTRTLDGAPLQTGEVRVRYVPRVRSGRLRFVVDGLDGAGHLMARGDGAVAVVESGPARLRVRLRDATPTASGTGCTSAVECQSGFCIDGVCCATPCDGACLTCAAPGSVGSCVAVPAGYDPRDACAADAAGCGLDGACDGSGACRLRGPEHECEPARCDAGLVTFAGTCDGHGSCKPGDTRACAPYTCDETGSRCRSSCSQNGDCAATAACAAASCGLVSLGGSCGHDYECLDGRCVDGVCCDAPGGACPACQRCGALGHCGAVAADDVDARCVATPASSCGTSGRCDGNGSCARWPRGTSCAPQRCSGSTLVRATTCDGAGVCRAADSVSCGPFVCASDGIDCLRSCRGNDDCLFPSACVRDTCGRLADGAACSSDAQCDTGHCTDGVCCASDGCDTCRSCAVVGHLGKCWPREPGAADARCVDEGGCGHDGRCDGGGSCSFYPTGRAVSDQRCQAGQVQPAASCDGGGHAVSAAPRSCGAYRCDVAARACRSVCTVGDGSCAPGYVCLLGACVEEPLPTPTPTLPI